MVLDSFYYKHRERNGSKWFTRKSGYTTQSKVLAKFLGYYGKWDENYPYRRVPDDYDGIFVEEYSYYKNTSYYKYYDESPYNLGGQYVDLFKLACGNNRNHAWVPETQGGSSLLTLDNKIKLLPMNASHIKITVASVAFFFTGTKYINFGAEIIQGDVSKSVYNHMVSPNVYMVSSLVFPINLTDEITIEARWFGASADSGNVYGNVTSVFNIEIYGYNPSDIKVNTGSKIRLAEIDTTDIHLVDDVQNVLPPVRFQSSKAKSYLALTSPFNSAASPIRIKLPAESPFAKNAGVTDGVMAFVDYDKLDY